MRNVAAVIFGLVLLFLSGCGLLGRDLPESNGDTSNYCQAVGTNSLVGESAHKIVNGVVTSTYPSVLKISVRRTDGSASCTATAVSSTTLITARHCLGDSRNGTVYYGSTAATRSVYSQEVDLAVAVFAEGTFSSFSQVANAYPSANDMLALVGYGQTDFEGNNETDGQKRVGCNRLVGFADRPSESTDYSKGTINHNSSSGDYLFYRSKSKATQNSPAGQDAMTGRGDSGGPVFIGGKLAGVVAYGGKRAGVVYANYVSGEPSATDRDNTLYEYDTNLLSPAARRLLQRAQSEIGANINGL